jgi:hypothetical protein
VTIDFSKEEKLERRMESKMDSRKKQGKEKKTKLALIKETDGMRFWAKPVESGKVVKPTEKKTVKPLKPILVNTARKSVPTVESRNSEVSVAPSSLVAQPDDFPESQPLFADGLSDASDEDDGEEVIAISDTESAEEFEAENVVSAGQEGHAIGEGQEDVFQEVDNEVIVGEESSDSTDNPEEKQLIHKRESILLNVDAEQHEAVDSCDVNLAVGRKKKVLKKAGPKKTTDVGLGRPKKKKAAPDASEEGFNLVSEKRKKMPAVSEPPSTSAAPSAKVDVMQNRGEFSKFLNSLYTFKTPNILHRSLCLV